MLSDLDMANWNTSMLRTGVGYDWNYDADKGIRFPYHRAIRSAF